MPGKNLAIGSLVCGILSLVLIFVSSILIFSNSIAFVLPIIGLILAIVSIVLAVNSKKQGFDGGIQKAGLVLGIIGTVLCGITFMACVFCIGAATASELS